MLLMEPEWSHGLTGSTHLKKRNLCCLQLRAVKSSAGHGQISKGNTQAEDCYPLSSSNFSLMAIDCCCSVTQLCLTLFDPVDCSTPASMSITISWSLLKFRSIGLVRHPTISSSVVPFSCCPQSFPASGSFPMS